MSSLRSLGALPFAFMGRLTPAYESLANSLACGVMLAASFDLIHEVRPRAQLLRRCRG